MTIARVVVVLNTKDILTAWTVVVMAACGGITDEASIECAGDQCDTVSETECASGECDAGPSPAPDAIPSCAEVSLEETESPVFASQDPNVYYYLPSEWVLEDTIEGRYWRHWGSYQHYDPEEFLQLEAFNLSLSMRLVPAETREELEVKLQESNPNAQLHLMPIGAAGADRVQFNVVGEDNLLAVNTSFQVEELRLSVTLDLTRSGFESMSVLLREKAGIGVVSARLSFACNDGVQTRQREVFPQASGASIESEALGITVDESAGHIANSIDQIMLVWTRAVPLRFSRVVDGTIVYDYDFAQHDETLARLFIPLLNYSGSKEDIDSAVNAAKAAKEIFQEAKSDLQESGYTEEVIEDRFRGLTYNVARLEEPDALKRFFRFNQ